MSEHKQIQLYVGLNEGGCVDVGTIHLAGFTLVSNSQLTEITAQNRVLREVLQQLNSLVGTAIRCDDAMCELLSDASDVASRVLMMTPLGCLREIEAKAIESVITDELYRIIKPKGGKDCVIKVEDYLEQCAAKIRQEPPQS